MGRIAAPRESFLPSDIGVSSLLNVDDSEPEKISNLPEQHLKTRPIQAQTTAMAVAMAVVRICNDERVRFGVVSGQGRRALRLTPRTVEA